MKKIKIVVCGSRSILQYEFVKRCLELEELNKDNTIIVSGHANGVDKLAERFAQENDIELEIYPANWDKYGKKAGFLRNMEMIDRSNKVIAIWDGISKGTYHSIKYAIKWDKLKAICYTSGKVIFY